MPVGELLREWRQRRHLSQLDLACEANISARHVSFLETGRSSPSREMILHLADRLNVPLRDRNSLLLAAGFAPVYPERGLQDPDLAAVREAMDAILTGHEPFPALAIDRHWKMIAANNAVGPLLEGVSPHLLQPPVNVMRLSLHADGVAPRIVNLPEWRAHLLHRLRRDLELTGDPVLEELHRELIGYPAPQQQHGDPGKSIAVPFKLNVGDRVLSFISTTTVFGTAVDVTLSEIAIESFFPADRETAEVLRMSQQTG